MGYTFLSSNSNRIVRAYVINVLYFCDRFATSLARTDLMHESIFHIFPIGVFRKGLWYFLRPDHDVEKITGLPVIWDVMLYIIIYVHCAAPIVRLIVLWSGYAVVDNCAWDIKKITRGRTVTSKSICCELSDLSDLCTGAFSIESFSTLLVYKPGAGWWVAVINVHQSYFNRQPFA